MGSISFMNASLNNNRKLLKNGKRKPFTKMNGGSTKGQSYKPYVLPKLQPHVLKRIRLKVKREQRKHLVVKLVIGFISLVLMFLYMIYLTH